MSRLKVRTIATADPIAAPILQSFKDKYGIVPNFYAALGIDGATLSGYLAFEGAIEKNCLLTDKQREMISLAVANYNSCHYCVSGHTFSGKKLGMKVEECAEAQRGIAADSIDQAILNLSLDIIRNRGALSDESISNFLAAGLSEETLIQVCAWTGINSFSNWINNVVQPKIDFPKVALQ